MSTQMESVVLPQHQGRRPSARGAFFGGIALGVFMTVLLAWPLGAHSQAAKEAAAPRPAEKPDLIQPGDRLRIYLANSLPSAPLCGVFRVEHSGKVSLGPDYGGRVQLKGLTLEQAEVAIQKHLRRMVKEPQVEVIRYDPVVGTGGPGRAPSLEERIGRLEEEVRALRTAIEELPKKLRDKE